MKIKIIKIIAALVLIGAVIAAALGIKSWRDSLKADEPYKPKPGESYDPDRLPDWDLN